MKRTTALILLTAFVASLSIAATLPTLRPGWQWLLPVAQAQRIQPTTRRKVTAPLEDFDVRANLKRDLPAPPETSANQTRTRQTERIQETHLSNEPPKTNIKWSSLTGTPSRVDNLAEPLTQASEDDADVVSRRFLKQNRGVFRMEDSEVQNLKLSRRDRTNHNGISHLSYDQNVAGTPVFQGRMQIHVDRSGAVIATSGELIPQAESVINRTQPSVNQAQALNAALEFSGADQSFVLAIQSKLEARLVYFPLAADALRLGWEFTIWMPDTPDVYLVIVDAERSSLLFRHNYTSYENPHGLVFAGDSPRPDAPHISDNPPIVERQDLPFKAGSFLSQAIFPEGDKHLDWWAGLTANSLISNNADAHLDRSPSDNIADEPLVSAPASNFSFPLDFSKAPTDSDNQKAAQANLFYWTNRYHDILYAFGFTESAGNFQTNNFGLGGAGNDAVQADAQDGSGTNNANFSTPPDGRAGRMQMYLWNSSGTNLDGDFDQGVILHELTHGLTNRLVGNGSGLTGNQSRGMGEGWSDYFGLALLRKESDEVDGSYGVGQYVRGNYAIGIRRYPYSTSKAVNPLTFAGIALNTEVHRIGEIWCNTLWEMRASLIKKYGFAEGQRQSLQLVVDGLKLTPNGPGFIEARDAILLADRVNNNGANQCLLWQAFSKRGLGYLASSLGADDLTPVESFDVPPTCSDAGILSVNKRNYLSGETIKINIADRNAGNAIQVLVTSSASGDSETLTIPVESNFPGSFKSQIRIAFGKTVTNDGILQASVEAGDQIKISYQDTNTGAGASSFITTDAFLTREKIIWQDNVESGNQGWIATGNWNIVASQAASATHSWTDSPSGNYLPNTDTSITTPLLDCTNLSEITLHFSQRYNTEGNFDFATVESSNDDGNTWNRAAAFSGSSNGFIQTEVKLDALAGKQNARIRFRLKTDPNDHFDGWYVDDIRISGRSANASIIKPNDQQAPIITAISPAFGAPAGGMSVTITGANFGTSPETTVSFDGVAANNIKVISNSLLTATAPTHTAGAVSVRVKNAYGEATLANGFTYFVPGSTAPPLTISQIFPNTASTRGGAIISIVGSNFTPETSVKFGTTQVISTFVSASLLRAVVPVAGAAGTVAVSAFNTNFSSSLLNAFTYTNPTPPGILVTTPTPGFNVFTSGVLAINWASRDNHTIVKHRVSLLRDQSLMAELATELSGEVQSLNYVVPTSMMVADNYRIRVVATDDEGAESEAFSGFFSISRAWQSTTSMPQATMKAAAVADKNYLYFVGGQTASSVTTATNALRKFDPSTNLWSTLSPMPMPLTGLDSVFLKGKIYIPGGNNNGTVVATNYVYDVASDAWAVVANNPTALSSYACASDPAAGIMYVTGGSNSAISPTVNVRSFDVNTNLWTSYPTMKTARYAHRAALIAGKLYVAGGFGIAGGLSNCEVFDFATQTWSNIAPLNRARAYASSTVYQDAFGNPYWLIIGGEDASTRTTIGSAEVYDVRNDRWIALDESFTLNTIRTQSSGAAIGNLFYVLGGGTGSATQPTASSTVERIQLPLNLSSAGAPPTLAVPAAQLAVAGAELQFSVLANDLGSKVPLAITVSNLPAGASFETTTITNNATRGQFRWTPNTSDTGKNITLLFKASDGNLNETKSVTVSVVKASALGVVNAAHYRGGSLPSDSIASAFGTDLSLRTEAAPSLPLPNELAGTQVMVNGIAAQLLYVSPTQVNFVMPSSLESGPATILIKCPNGNYALAISTIAVSTPSLFTTNAAGSGDAAAQATSDGVAYTPAPFDVTVNGKSNYLILFGTGFRHAAAANPADENGVAESVKVTIDGQDAKVLYCGAQGFYVGLDQLNIEIPATIKAGARRVEVIVTLNGIEANRVTISLK